MEPASSRIWTRVTVFISYDDNHYNTGTSEKNPPKYGEQDMRDTAEEARTNSQIRIFNRFQHVDEVVLADRHVLI